jgi:integrase
MGDLKKSKSKAKEPITIRFKNLKTNGSKSIYLDCYRNGKRVREFLKAYIIPERTAADKEANAETMRLANAVKAQRIVELQNSAHGFSATAGRSRMNLIEYVQKYADKKKEKAGGNERGTYMTYMALIYHLRQYGGEKTTFKQTDKKYCIGFLDYLKSAKSTLHDRLLSGTTQRLYMGMLETVLNAAIADEVTDVNPFKQIKPEDKPKRVKIEISYLTIDEVAILEKTPFVSYPVIRSAFLFSCYTGLRFSDVDGLTWGRLRKSNEGNMQINYVQKKTKKQEYLPIPQKAVGYLPERGEAKDTDKVFKLPTGGYVNLHLKLWAELAGINRRITFHTARHTYATALLSLGAKIETISKNLGHSDIKTTQAHYAAIEDKLQRDAVNLFDRLNGLTK